MSDTRYSINKRIWIIKNKYLLHYPISIQPKWRKEFHTEPPTRPSIDLLFRKWETTGSVHDAARSGCPITIRTEEKKNKSVIIMKKIQTLHFLVALVSLMLALHRILKEIKTLYSSSCEIFK